MNLSALTRRGIFLTFRSAFLISLSDFGRGQRIGDSFVADSNA